MKTIFLDHNSIFKGELILVNASHPYRENIAGQSLELRPVGESTVCLEQNTARILSDILSEINGWETICAVSGWRSIEEQREIYIQSLKDNGRDFTEQFVALPGHSEHQTGMAIDLGVKKEVIDFIRPDFPDTGLCHQFRQRAVSGGFIERYPKEKEPITGISHEPWHFRYVGMPHSEIMKAYGFCLEEYLDFLRQYSYPKRPYLFQTEKQKAEISYLPAGIGNIQIQIDEQIPYMISGNNMDGYIITQWRQL